MPTPHVEFVVSPWVWAGFLFFVIAMLALDLGVFHRKAHAVTVKESLVWVVVWIGLALAFNVGIYYWMNKEKALEFFTGFVIEKALSVDNLFVFIVIFSYFKVPTIFQHRVLFWGILGALIMRAVFIFAGISLIERFHWLIFVFGALLIFTGIKILMQKDHHEDNPEKNFAIRLFRKFFPTTTEYHGAKFLVLKDGKKYATPLMLALVVVESTDVIFAVDSIPAIFAVTRDPFIVYTSNVFAILGLRSLFFALAGMMEKFHYLKVGLGIILSFVGVKMLISETEYKIPIEISLLVILGVLALSVIASLLRKPTPKATTTTTNLPN